MFHGYDGETEEAHEWPELVAGLHERPRLLEKKPLANS